jgi:hypothetical protein
MFSRMKAWLAGLCAVALVGCGGGGGGGTPFVGGGGGTSASNLVLVLSQATIPNSGTATVTATVTAVDGNNNIVANVPVTIKADNGATVTPSDTKTGADGKVTAQISVGSNRDVRIITVTAESGSLSKSTPLQVVENTGNTKQAADMTLTLSSPQLNNSGTQTVRATAVAVDGNRNTIAGIPVSFSVNASATVKVGAAETDADGKVTADISIGDDKANRFITITATSGTLVRTAQVQVIGSKIRATALPAVIEVGQVGKVQFRLLDVSDNPIAGKTITIIGPGGVQTTATSNANGDYEYTYTAPTVGGELIVRASALGVETTTSILVKSGGQTIPDVTTTVQSASVAVSPNVVPVNTGTTNNQATVRALFLAANNAPVPNIRVRFDLDGDKQSIGGTFTSGSTIVYADAAGTASTSYIPGGRFSPTDGVTVRACWDYADFPAGTCPREAKSTLTVTSQALSVSVGTNNLIGEDATGLKYVNRYVVQVVDSSGLAASDVQISATMDLLQYHKGFWVPVIGGWVQEVKARCDNEDLNRNGVSEVFANGVVEDANGSFNLTTGRPALEPRRADVAVSFEGSTRTNTSGSVVLRLEYPKNLGSWVKFNLVIGAAGVAGTEGRANFVEVLPVAAKDVSDPRVSPPFVRSPYGIEESGFVQAREPGNTAPPATLCTNPN